MDLTFTRAKLDRGTTLPRLVAVAATEGVFDCRYALPDASYPVNEVAVFDFSCVCFFCWGRLLLLLGAKGLSSESSLSMQALAIACSILAVSLPVPASERVCFQHQRWWNAFYGMKTNVSSRISHDIIIVTIIVFVFITVVLLGPCGQFLEIIIYARNAALSTTLEVYLLIAVKE